MCTFWRESIWQKNTAQHVFSRLIGWGSKVNCDCACDKLEHIIAVRRPTTRKRSSPPSLLISYSVVPLKFKQPAGEIHHDTKGACSRTCVADYNASRFSTEHNKNNRSKSQAFVTWIAEWHYDSWIRHVFNWGNYEGRTQRSRGFADCCKSPVCRQNGLHYVR